MWDSSYSYLFFLKTFGEELLQNFVESKRTLSTTSPLYINFINLITLHTCWIFQQEAEHTEAKLILPT